MPGAGVVGFKAKTIEIVRYDGTLELAVLNYKAQHRNLKAA